MEALLRLHHRQRVAHVLDDPELLVGSMAPILVEVGRGHVTPLSRAAARARFESYLAAVRFLEWEDVRPPRIRISPDGGWAEVVVEKRVRSLPADTTESKAGSAVVFAWVERWVRDGAAWRLATIASTERPAEAAPSASLASEARAWEILRRAREAMGGEGAVARVGTLRFVAEVESPGGDFVTEVASARDGRVRFEQRLPDRPDFAAGVSLDGPWRRDGERVVDSVGHVLATVITGHEIHLLAVAPEARYSAPSARPPQVLDGREVEVVELSDALGAPVRFFYDADTGLPAGFQPVNHTGRGAERILTRFDDWRSVGEVMLPMTMTITHGEDTYHYRVANASVAWLPDEAFRPGGAGVPGWERSR